MIKEKQLIKNQTIYRLILSLLFIFITLNSLVITQPNSLANDMKSSGNEVMKSIEAGKDYKGMSKEEVVAEIGEPWRKDTTAVKARYDEKWIYSCQAKDGLTYDCVFLYFMGSRVVSVEVL